MSKPRSILETKLNEAQQSQLADWLLSGMQYHQAQAAVAKEFGVTVKSLASFSQFWDKHCSPSLLARRTRAKRMADEVAEEAAKHPAQFSAATIDQLSQKAFELATSPGADPRDVKALFSLVLKSKDQELTREQMQLDREKFLTATRSKIEAGLAELAQHIKGNEDAARAFDAFKATVANLS
jgi:hypothetical protein